MIRWLRFVSWLKSLIWFISRIERYHLLDRHLSKRSCSKTIFLQYHTHLRSRRVIVLIPNVSKIKSRLWYQKNWAKNLPSDVVIARCFDLFFFVCVLSICIRGLNDLILSSTTKWDGLLFSRKREHMYLSFSIIIDFFRLLFDVRPESKKCSCILRLM